MTHDVGNILQSDASGRQQRYGAVSQLVGMPSSEAEMFGDPCKVSTQPGMFDRPPVAGREDEIGVLPSG